MLCKGMGSNPGVKRSAQQRRRCWVPVALRASAPAYADETVRVVTTKTKKELVGKLGSDGIVEVRL